MVNELQKNKNKINLIKKTFIFFLILIIFSPIFIAFQQSSSGLQELKSCETYHSALQINSEKVFKLSQLNREFSIDNQNNMQLINIKQYLIKIDPSSINCIGKIWKVDLEKNEIYVASNYLIFQVFKLLGYLFIFLCLLKSGIFNLINLAIANLIFTASLNYVFNFQFRFFLDLKFYGIHFEILDSVIISLVFYGLTKLFITNDSYGDVYSSFNFSISKYAFIFYLILYLLRILYLFSTPYQNTDVIQEWLINYNYGFIRRGLFGTFLIKIMSILNLDIQILMYVFIVLIYSIFCLLLFRIIKNKTFDFYSLLILISPLFFNYNLFLKSTILLPKELLGYISLIIFFLFQNTKKKTTLALFIFTYIVSVLTHEVNLILLPTIFYVSFFKSPKKINRKAFLLVLVLSVFILIMISNSDTKNIFESICLETFNKYTPDMGCRKSEILDTNLLENTKIVRENIFSSGALKYYVLTYTIIILLGLIPFFLNGWINNNILYISLLLTSLCALSLVGLDWGRWINIIFTHLSIYFIYFDLEKYKNNKIHINRFFQAAVIFLYSFYWSAPQCCVNEYTFYTQIGHIYKNFSIYLIFIIFILFKNRNVKYYKFLHSIFGNNSIK